MLPLKLSLPYPSQVQPTLTFCGKVFFLFLWCPPQGATPIPLKLSLPYPSQVQPTLTLCGKGFFSSFSGVPRRLPYPLKLLPYPSQVQPTLTLCGKVFFLFLWCPPQGATPIPLKLSLPYPSQVQPALTLCGKGFFLFFWCPGLC